MHCIETYNFIENKSKQPLNCVVFYVITPTYQLVRIKKDEKMHYTSHMHARNTRFAADFFPRFFFSKCHTFVHNINEWISKILIDSAALACIFNVIVINMFHVRGSHLFRHEAFVFWICVQSFIRFDSFNPCCLYL